MKYSTSLSLLLLPFLLYAKDGIKSVNVENIFTKGLDENVAKVFKQTKKLILQARKNKDEVIESIATQQWCFLLHNYNFTSQAQSCYQIVGMLDKNNAQWPYLYAKTAMQQGDFESADEGLKETIRRDKNYLSAHFYTIKNAIDQNQLAQAFAKLDEVPIALRLTSSLLNIQGDLYFAIENYHIAIGFYQQTLTLVPKAKSLNYKIAKAYQILGNDEQAKEYMQISDATKVQLFDPYFKEVKNTIVGEIPYLIKAKTALLNKDIGTAIKLYKKALEFNPKSETALVNSAVAYFQNKQLDLAVETFKQVLSYNPTQQKALFNLAMIYRIQGKDDEALNSLLKLFAINKQDSEVNYNLAAIFYKKSDYEKVLELAQINGMQTHLNMQYLKAKALIQMQKFTEALTWLNEINKNVPNQYKVLLSLSKLYSQVPDKSLRSPKLALKYAKAAMQLKNNEQSQWQMIQALDESNQCQKVKTQIQQLADLLKLESKNIYVKLVQQRGQALNCTYIHDKP
jgi:tetratricopeptide (TPR) repeat protein